MNRTAAPATLALVAALTLAGCTVAGVPVFQSAGGAVNLALNVVTVYLLAFGLSRWQTAADRAERRADAAERDADVADAANLAAWDRVPFPVVRTADGPVAGAMFAWVNRAAVERWGYSFEDLTSRPYESLLHPESDPAQTRAAADAKDAGGSYDLHVNAYAAGPLDTTPGRQLHQRWYSLDDAGRFALALPIDAEVRAAAAAKTQRTRAEEAEADLDAIRPAVDALIRIPTGPVPAQAPAPAVVPLGPTLAATNAR